MVQLYIEGNEFNLIRNQFNLGCKYMEDNQFNLIKNQFNLRCNNTQTLFL